MISICRTALSLILLLSSMESPARTSLVGIVLEGVVVDEQGRPVVGAEIQITPAGQAAEEDEAVTAHSRVGGAFRIEGLEPGTLYRMITWKPGFVPRQDDDLDPSFPAGELRLALQRGRTATGHVVDAAGEPVADAVLDLSQTSGYGNWIHPDVSPLEERLRRTRTGAAGTFSLPDLAPGAYELLILRPGLAPQRRALEVPSGKGPLDFGRIEIGGAVLTGKVTDPSGRPLANAIIWLRRDSDQLDGFWGRAPSTRTGDDGTFRIAGLPPYGEVGLDVCAAGFLPEEMTLWDVSSELVPIVLQPGGRITGRVVDPDGMPVAGAELYTLRAGQSGGCEINSRPCDWDEDSTTSGADGRFVLGPLLATTYTLRVHAPDHLSKDIHGVRVGPGEVIEDLRVTLERGDELSGQVADAELEELAPEPEPVLREVRGRVVGLEGEPLAGVQVSAQAARTLTDAAGAFSLSLRLREGASYWVFARKPGLALSSEQVEVGGSSIESLEIRMLPEAVITGRVLGLEPWELASLRVGSAWGRRFSTLASVNREGTYRMSHLASRSERIRAEAAGRSVEATVEIEEGQLEAVLDLHFPPVHEVRGWVVDAAGRPVPRAEVEFDRNLLNEREVVTSTRADGSFSVRLEDGVYAVAVRWRSLRDDPEMQRVEIRGGPVDRVELEVD